MVCVVNMTFNYSENVRINNQIAQIIPLLIGTLIILFFVKGKLKTLFNKPVRLWYLLPCLLVAANNLPFIPWISGENRFANVSVIEIALFIVYCLLIGTFEETVFRGALFPALLSVFNKSKSGLIKAMITSSTIFGVTHLINLISGAGIVETLLQVVYTTLIGGMCAFLFFKTNSIIPSIIVHVIYNLCGLLFDAKIGLGLGITIDLPTVIVTVLIGALVGSFVIIKLISCTNEEVEDFYERLKVN